MRFDHDWDMPAQWRDQLLPRHGGIPVPAPAADPEAPERLRQLLATPAPPAGYDAGLLAEAEAFAADLGRPGAELSARGAAAAALVRAETIAARQDWRAEPGTPFAAAWIARGGLVFAVRAVAEMAGMLFHPRRAAGSLCLRPDASAPPRPYHYRNESPESLRETDEHQALFVIARAIRAHVAAADDATYARAAAALHHYRDGVLPQRIVASFVLPDQDGWVDADVAALPGWFAEFPRHKWTVLHLMPVFSASSGAQVRRHLEVVASLEAHEDIWDLRETWRAVTWIGGRTLLGTLLDGLGTEAVWFLTEEPILRDMCGLQASYHRRMEFDSLAEVLLIPADEAVRFVIRDTLPERPDDFHRLGVATLDPARVLRLLAEPDAPPLAADVLGMRLLAEPALRDLLAGDALARVPAVVGAEMARLIEHPVRPWDWATDRDRLISWLASIATDEAFGLLAALADRGRVRPVVVRLAARHPERALRVLSGPAPERPEAAAVVAELLRDHVLAHPGLVRTLADPARAEAILAAHDPGGPDAPEEALPAALRTGPKSRPLPPWIVVPALPRVRLRDRDRGALPEPAVRRLLAMLSRSTFAAPDPGLADVRDACDRADLVTFGWALLDRWAAVEHPSADKQALFALGFLGDDTALPRLTELVLGWSESAIARAKIALDVFVALGTDAALTHLQRMARTAKVKGFRKQAAQKLTSIADARGLTTAELADRIASDLGLDAEGRIPLDYGPRHFSVGFDVRLNPLVHDADGRRLRGLPRAAATDDPERAEEAKRAFAALKKEARALAVERGRALEDAMVTGRSWSAPDARRMLFDHPAVRYLARALLWQVAGGPAFRVAEDGTLADVDDKTLTLADDQRVSLYHPALGGADHAAWAETFADYEIFQPFPQLDREVHRPDPAQAAARVLPLETGGDLDVLHPLVARGWAFNANGGVQHEWPGGFITQITPDDISVTAPDGATFGDLPPVAASETFRDAHRVAVR